MSQKQITQTAVVSKPNSQPKKAESVDKPQFLADLAKWEKERARNYRYDSEASENNMYNE